MFFNAFFINNKIQLIMLGHNQTQLDSFNKNIPKYQGTLIANWYEQRVHRENNKEGRATTKSHLPKKHQQLLTTNNFPKLKGDDDTKFRILGNTNHALPRTENYHYGKGISKADSMPKVGKRGQIYQQLYLKEVKMSIEEQEQRKQGQERKGTFETTNRTTFVPKPLDQNRVGRLNMYDQSGNHVDLASVDEDMRESLGFKARGQISSDEELRKLVETNVGYERQQPITFWRQKLTDGTFYMSKSGSNEPFAKNNQFLKTFQHYKHYKD